MSQEDLFVKENDNVILYSNDKKFYFIKAQVKGKVIKMTRAKLKEKDLIGHKWGSFFRIKNDKLETYLPQEEFNPDLLKEIEEEEEIEKKEGELDEDSKKEELDGTEENEDEGGEELEEKNEKSEKKQKKTTSTVQKLSSQNITQMRQQGKSGNQIIKALVENSTTFAIKSEFSKEKYISRKKKRHDIYYQVLRPSSKTVHEAFFEFSPSKIGFVRPDSLAFMLNMANIHPNITVLVVDTCCGLILGSVMERLGGYGNVINVYYGSNLPSLKVLSNFNFPSHYFEKLFHIPFDELPHLNSKPSPKYSRVRELLTEGVDSFLLVSKFEPKSIFFSLYQYLNLSKTFIVYSTFAQPLAECYIQLLKSGEAIGMDLSENWLRDYQVLPQRTHPNMQMHGTSGYIFSGIKVSPGDLTSTISTNNNIVNILMEDNVQESNEFSSPLPKKQKLNENQ